MGSRISWLPPVLVVALALAMIATVLIPVHFWHHPENEATYHGFDSNLIYADPKGSGWVRGSIEITAASLVIAAIPASEPTVDLLTSPLGFTASTDIRILQASSTGSLRIGVWSPATSSGYFVRFGGAPSFEVSTLSVIGGRGSLTLEGGQNRNSHLGTYVPGGLYRISLSLAKATRKLSIKATELDAPLGGASALDARSSVDAANLPELFQAFRPTLAVSLATSEGIYSAVLENFTVQLPSQPNTQGELVEQIDDNRAQLLTILLASLGLLAAIIKALSLFWGRRYRPLQWHFHGPGFSHRFWVLALFMTLLVAYAAFNAWLFHLGTPHFDVYAAKMWSYIASDYSYLDLYHRPLIVPAAGIQAGVPDHEASFPYGPAKVYFYLAMGWIYRLTLAEPHTPIDTFRFEVLLKSFNVLFGVFDALLVYAILDRFGVTRTHARISTAFFMLNPVVIFLMSIWGSTETVSFFFILLSVWLASRAAVPWAWIALAIGANTRPQMLVLALLLGCVYIRVLSPAQNLHGVSWAVIAFFVFVAPISLGISPSMPLDYITHVVGFQIGAGQADKYSAVSPGYYSIWTLPLLYVQNQHGLGRMWYPRTAELVGQISYTQAGALLVVVFLLATCAAILIRRPRGEIRDYLPLVAFGTFGWLMLSTSLISRYFVYAVILVILCRGAFRSSAYYLSVGWLTAVTLITSWSHFGFDLLGANALSNPINPVNSSLSRAVQGLFLNDRFITDATVANLIALVFLGSIALRASLHTDSRDRASEPLHAPVS